MRPDSILPEHIAAVPLFRGLSRTDLAWIARAAAARQLKRSQVLFRHGGPASSLFIVVQGRFKATQVTADGHEVLLRFVGPGQMLGGTALLGDAVYPLTATAVEASSVLGWSSAAVGEFAARCPGLALNAMRLMAERIVELQDRWRELGTEQVDRRVARALLRLARQTGVKVEGGILLNLRLSRQDLAQMTGTTLFTASRILSRWKQRGLLDAGRQRVLLRRPHALVCIAEDLPPAAGDGGDERGQAEESGA